MRIIFLGFLLFSAGNLWASSGLVETVNGKTFEGETHLESDAIIITDTNHTVTRVELAELSFLQFRPPPPSDVFTPTGPVQDSRATELTNPTPHLSPTPQVPTLTPAKARLPAGVMMSGGSIMARRISSADETSVQLFDSTNEIRLSTVNIARILFQPLPKELEERIQPGRRGVLLSSKEFVEGEFKGFAQGQIRMSSVLFGMKAYDPGQVIAVILRDVKPAQARYELKTRDESLFLVNTLRLEKDSILLQDAALAGVHIAAADLLELRKKAPALLPLPSTGRGPG